MNRVIVATEDMRAAREAREAKSNSDLRLTRLVLFVLALAAVISLFSVVWAVVVLVLFGAPLPFMAAWRIRHQPQRLSDEQRAAIRRVPVYRDPRWRRQWVLVPALVAVVASGVLLLPAGREAWIAPVALGVRQLLFKWVNEAP